MKRTVEVLSDKAALVERSLQIVVEQLKSAIAERGFCTIALAGGSTPKPLYEAIAKQDLPWDKTHVFWGDERYVSADHANSNEGMARKAWLSHVDIPARNVHPMPTHQPEPSDSAVQYEQEIQAFFKTQPGELPKFDVILLGTGDDGHTASLFPHTDALNVSDRLVTVGNKDGQPRITLTAPLINQARCVLFLVAGANKQDALAHIFAEEDDNQQYPARMIQPEGELIWLLDRAAGEKLDA